MRPIILVKKEPFETLKAVKTVTECNFIFTWHLYREITLLQSPHIKDDGWSVN